MSLASDEVNYYVGKQWLLNQVSLAMRPGELLALVGPNGAGKSTLLQLLTGERQPTHGQILLDGRPLPDWPAWLLARRRAVLPQSSSLAFPFTALEVVLLGRTPHCVGGERDRDRHIAWQALAVADVVGLAERLYTTLSGGERQRVQLARVMAQIWDPPLDGSPRYLLLDEPVSSLDLAHQHAVLTLAHRLSRRGSGVLAVLHDLNLAAQYADRIAVLQAGRLQALGTPRDVLQAALIQQVFGVQARVAWDDELTCPVVSVVPRIHAMSA